jgi:polyphosphate kinase 2 (PPK2 family)
MPGEKNAEPTADDKLKRKEYERELARLHVEFVKLQQWVVHKGLKVCILFEGRDGAGKGGTIKAITERVVRASFAWWRYPRPPSARSRRCTPNATSRICRRPGKS